MSIRGGSDERGGKDRMNEEEEEERRGGNAAPTTGADEIARQQQFKHVWYANLVQERDPSARDRSRMSEPTGEAETLRGRIDPHSMGDRARPAPKKPKSTKEQEEKQQTAPKTVDDDNDDDDELHQHSTALKRKENVMGLNEESLQEGYYKPKSKASQSAFEALLEIAQRFLGDEPRDVLRGAAEEVLTAIKDEKLKTNEKLQVISKALSSSSLSATISQEKLAEIIQICSRINDFTVKEPKQQEPTDVDAAKLLNEPEDDDGVAVVFDRDAEEQKQKDDENDAETEQIVEEDEDEEEEEGKKKDVKVKSGILDLESLAFQQGGHLMSNTQCKLPPGSFRTAKKGYDEIHVPKSKPPSLDESKLVSIETLDPWTRPLFPENVKRLNYVQSAIYNAAYFTPDNILVTAPTSSGKTICAMLCMLHEIGLHRFEDGSIDTDAFKIVYIAPMKSLVQEMAGNFAKRFEPLGLIVRELSGDSSLTKRQLSETQIIVTTPEKWDIVTRKADGGGAAVCSSTKLVIIDEVHLLHDSRGPVLEAIVSRTLRQVEQSQEHVRLVGLSATLPNYEDVATFLRVENKNVFAFDNSYRPVPLEQTYVGVNEKKPLKRMQLMNEITFELVSERAGKHQVLVFVHSRKETAKTARFIRDAAVTAGIMSKFVRDDASGAASREILQTEAQEVINSELRDLLPHGFAIHHAGLSKNDRRLVEDLFADGHLQVLVSTSTLAWGVNLPCHSVIIKGTQIYNPEQGRWCELSPLDVMQMIGRAGRPQYDSEGEGIVITTHGELQYYLSLLNHQLPIESQFISRLPDALNAEITLGTVQSIKEAVTWLAYTYLYVRMLRNPQMYGVPSHNDGNKVEDEEEEDPMLENYRSELIHSAAAVLEKNGLIRYDRRSGTLQSTDLGRVASHFYVSHQSMAVYGEHLRPTMTDVELFRLFSLSNEFKLIPVRAEEKPELERLTGRVPIPIKEGIDEPAAKVNVLLQAYISRLKLEGFALASDMVYVTQSAGRIARALFEIALRRGWAQLAERTLVFSSMIEHRLWQSQTPLRQFSQLGDDIARKIERQDHCSFEHLYELSSQELGSLVNAPERGKHLWRLVHAFPRLEITASVQPLTRAMLLVDLVATPDFTFDEQLLNGNDSIGFWVFVEDVDCEKLLHSEYLVIKKRYSDDDHALSFTVPISEPLPPHYFVRVCADRWLGSQISIPLSFRRLILPDKFPPHTELLDLAPLSISSAFENQNSSYINIYKTSFQNFNPIQTQVFPVLFGSDENALVCAPPGSGHTVLAEFAILRAFEQSEKEKARIVCIVPMKLAAEKRFREWNEKFTPLGKVVNELTGGGGGGGSSVADELRILDNSDLVVTTPQVWDQLSRRWRQRKQVQQVRLFIVDDLHLVGSGSTGTTLEFIVSRMRFISSQQNTASNTSKQTTTTAAATTTRIVGLCVSVANAKDIGEWIGATPKTTFSFHPGARPIPLEVHIQGFESAEHTARMASMTRPLLQAVQRHGNGNPVIIFTPSKRDAYSIARELALFAINDLKEEEEKEHNNKQPSIDQTRCFLHIPIKDIEEHSKKLIRGQVQRELLSSGIGVIHEGIDSTERSCIERLFSSGAISILIVTHEQAWATELLSAHLVIVMGTESYDGREHRYVDYPVAEILEMTSRSTIATTTTMSSDISEHGGGGVSKCVVFCAAPRKEFLKRFLFEALPVESHVDRFLHDHINAEVAARTIASKQDAVDYLTWTLAYRRLQQNPNYYGMTGSTHQHISDHLSELVETTLSDLEKARCVSVDEENGMDVSPLNLGIVAAYYGISHVTVELFSASLTERTKLRGLVEVLCAAAEFDDIPVRHHEENTLRRISNHLPIHVIKKSQQQQQQQQTQSRPESLKDPHIKANVLLQTHMIRKPLPTSELAADQNNVIEKMPKLIQALVDVASSCGWLSPAISAMELSQLITQAMWETDPTLKQLPHVSDETIQKLKTEHKVESVFELAEMEDSARRSALSNDLPSARQMRDVAVFCNDYPNLEVSYQILTSSPSPSENVVQVGEQISVNVSLDHGGIQQPVHAPYFPGEKQEEWWIIIGNQARNQLATIKRINFTRQQKQQVRLEFSAPPEPGKYEFTITIMCDSYLGCDQEYSFEINVLPSTAEKEIKQEKEQPEQMDTTTSSSS